MSLAGTTQTLINDLSRWSSLRVLTFQSVQNYSGSKGDSKSVGQKAWAQAFRNWNDYQGKADYRYMRIW